MNEKRETYEKWEKGAKVVIILNGKILSNINVPENVKEAKKFLIYHRFALTEKLSY